MKMNRDQRKDDFQKMNEMHVPNIEKTASLELNPPFPKYIMYDVTNVCNAACIHCAHPAVKTEPDYKPSFIDIDLFRKTLEEANQFNVDLIRLTADGEPLLHPRIENLLSMSKTMTGAAVNITTNGSLMKGRLLEKLLAVPPAVFDISLDAYYPKTYARIRVGLDFSEVKSNINELLRLRDPSQTKVIVSMIHRPELDEETIKFQDYWNGRVDAAVIRNRHSNGGLSGRVGIPVDTPRWPCQHLWGRLIIDFHGRIRYCPVDWRGESVLGSAEQVSLKDVWEGKQLMKLRREQLSGDFTGSGCCRRCEDWYTSPWDKGWLKLLHRIRGNEESLDES